MAEKKPIEVALVEDREDIRAQLAHTIGRSPSLRLLRKFHVHSRTEAVVKYLNT